MIHEMKLKSVYFDKIKNGKKIYEIRLNDEKRKNINIGDVVIFKKEPNLIENIQTKVKDLIYFNNFYEMTNTLPLEKLGFENLSKEEVEKIYHSFYSTEDELRFGVVAIKIEVLN